MNIKFSQNYRYSFEIIQVALISEGATPFAVAHLTKILDRGVGLDPKNPKHKKIIEGLSAKKKDYDMILRRYPFFYSIMPFLLFLEIVENWLDNIILNRKRFKRQITFLESFITGLAGVIHGS